jgi:hypothetical protein
MTNQWKSALKELNIDIDNKLKQKALLEQLIALEAQHAGDGHSESARGGSEEPKKRPARSRRKRPAAATGESSNKQMRLPAVLTAVGQEHKGKRMKYEELAQMVKAAGYESNSQNFNNMIYQALQKLCKRKLFTKDPETREYQFIGE